MLWSQCAILKGGIAQNDAVLVISKNDLIFFSFFAHLFIFSFPSWLLTFKAKHKAFFHTHSSSDTLI